MKTLNLIAVLIVAVILSTGCGGNSPSAPTPPSNPQASIVPVGDITLSTISGSPNSSQRNFAFNIKNEGAGCAINIRGTVTLTVTATGTAFSTASWRRPSIVLNPNETARVDDCCLTIPAAVTGHHYTITSTFDSGKC